MELTKFHGTLVANEATFEGRAWFNGATFKVGAWFNGATFKEETRFYGATFEERALFNKATFKVGAWFDEATFEGVASFSEATFEGEAWFNGATFEGRAWFNGATFKGEAVFAKAKFEGQAWFIVAKFEGTALFDRATFKKETLFDGATFKEVAWFIGATFEGRALFDGAKFEWRAWFKYLNIIGDSTYVVFRSTVFEKPHLVSFEGTNIMRFLFLSTKIEEISFRNAEFREEASLRVYDLLKNPKSRINFTFDDVIETYGRLRGNLEKNHRFSDAGIFFRGEMEARRMRPYYEFLRETDEKEGEETSFGRISFNLRKWLLRFYVELSPFALYKYFSEYGESVYRPLLCSFITIFLMAFLFTILGSPFFALSPQSFLRSLGESVGLFFQVTPVDYATLPSPKSMLQLLERILGLLFSALEVIALKRMLERHS
jgi:uncharacterized protein YjbI with pentapeptide repeats